MKKSTVIKLCVCAFSVLQLVLFSSCISENTSQRNSEVDFSAPQKVQILFNDNIYDTEIEYDGEKMRFTFCGENNAVNGTTVEITDKNYIISYSDMNFKGETDSLPNSFLPVSFFHFFKENGASVILDSFDEEKNCTFTTISSDGYFITLERYKTKDNKFCYAAEVK